MPAQRLRLTLTTLFSPSLSTREPRRVITPEQALARVKQTIGRETYRAADRVAAARGDADLQAESEADYQDWVAINRLVSELRIVDARPA